MAPVVMHPAASAAAIDKATPGTGTAAAYALNVGEQAGGAGIGIATFVKAFAKFADTTGHGEAQFYDPGILVLFASLQECNASAINPSSLPHPIIADTNETGGKPASQTQSQAGTGTSGAGTVSVSARPNANGEGDGNAGAATFPGLFQMTGGAVRTVANWDPGHLVRTVTAESEVGRLSLLNVVELDGMKWTAQQVVSGLDSRTSRAAKPVTSFSLGSVICTGPPEEVLAHPRVIESYLGTDEDAIQRSGDRPTPARRTTRRERQLRARG